MQQVSSPISVLFVGPKSGTSLHRQRAFERLGHRVSVFDARACLSASPWIDRFEWHASPGLLGSFVERRLRDWLQTQARFDLVFVDSGSLVTASAVRLLKSHAAHVVNFNHDDPFGKRDWVRFKAFRAAVPEYDLIIVVREPNIEEAKALGARDVMFHPRVSDEVEHTARALDATAASQWASEVSFVGSWMLERGPFMLDLVDRGVPLSLFGPRWNKAPEWPRLKAFHRAEYLDGDAYAYAVQASRISLGLLSKGNRDLHTTRSMEIPALGGLLCAERTPEHLEYYEEGTEALFWEDSAECASVCLSLLADEPRRIAIAKRGHRRHMANGHTSENLLVRVISRVVNL